MTLIDTAPVYGFGRSEEIVGKALEGSLRRKVTIATKVGLAWKDGAVYRDFRPARIRKEVEDLFRDGCARMSSTFTRCIGWTSRHRSRRPRGRWKTCAATARFGRSASAIFPQPRCVCSVPMPSTTPCSRLITSLSAKSRLTCCPTPSGAGLTILSYGALCRGLLSGRMTANTKFDGDDLRKVDPKFQGKRFRQYLTAVDELKRMPHERFGKSVLALPVRWVLDQGPTIALWGARNPSQLQTLIGDVDGWHIDPATKAEINAILKRYIVNPVSPAFMAPPVIRPKEQEAA